MTIKKSLVVLASLLIIGLALGIGWRYFAAQRAERQQAAYRALSSEALSLYERGDLDKAITSFASVERLAPSEADAVTAKLRLAFAMFLRNRGNDRVTAVGICKSVITDESVSPRQRAIAVLDLMDLYNASQDAEFAKRVIFSGEPFGSFFDGDDIELATVRAYQFADELHPFALAEFRIANYYANRLYSALAPEEQAALVDILRRWTEKAEKTFAEALPLGFEKSRLGYIYQMQGLARRALAAFSDKNYAPAERAFQNGLRALAPEEDTRTYGMGLYVRFHYAALLAQAHGEAPVTDIRRLVTEIMRDPPATFRDYPFTFYEFVKNEAGPRHTTHRHKKDLVRLGELVPEFRPYLAKHGFTQ